MLNFKRNLLLYILISILVSYFFASETFCQDKYPSRAIELVVPFAPGGTADVAARTYSDILSKNLKVTVNVVNRAGGTGIQGTTYVIRSKKDGYTLLGSTDTPLMIMPVINKEVTYDPLKDVIPIAHLGYAPGLIAVKSDSPFQTLGQLVQYARENPGKLKNSSAGIGTEAFFNLQILCSKEKIKIPTIPFKSGGEAVVSLLGGHTDLTSSSLASLKPQLKAGTIKGLVIFTKKRHPEFPEIPTALELGYPEIILNVWAGLFAPSGVPKEVLDVLIPAVEKTFKDPEVIQRATNAGLIVEFLGPEETRKLLETGYNIVKKIAPESGLVK